MYVFQSSNLGQELLDRVFKHLNLLETSYFGLRYLDHGNQTVGYNLFNLQSCTKLLLTLATWFKIRDLEFRVALKCANLDIEIISRWESWYEYNTYTHFSNGSIKAKNSASNWRFIKEILDRTFTLSTSVSNSTRRIRANSSKKLPGISLIFVHENIRLYLNNSFEVTLPSYQVYAIHSWDWWANFSLK